MMSIETKWFLEMVETHAQELGWKDVGELDPDKAERIDLAKRSVEIFQILVLKTDAEAKLLVKSVQGEDGLRAWQMLYWHYHRRTFAKAVRDHREVMYPRYLKDLSEVVEGVMEWEEKVNRTEKTYGAIPGILRIAALVVMLLIGIKDMALMSTEDDDQGYSKLKQKIFMWTGDQVLVGVGNVGGKGEVQGSTR